MISPSCSRWTIPGGRTISTCFALFAALALMAQAAIAGDPDLNYSPGCDAAPLSAGLSTFQFDHDGITRTYHVHVPAIYDHRKPTPLMLNLHSLVLGAAQIGIFRTFSAQTAFSETAGYIVVEPSGTGANPSDPPSWNAGLACCNPPSRAHVDDVAFIEEVLDRVAAQLCIDDRRVYASGMSNGGYLSHRLACELPDRFAAIAPVSGSFSSELVCETRGRAVPVLQISGSLDNLASRQASVDRWTSLNTCSADTLVSVDRDTTCTTNVECRNGVEVEHCVVDQGAHCFFSNVTHPLFPTCPYRDGPVAQDMIWDFVSRYTLPAAPTVPVPEPDVAGQTLATWLALSWLARRRLRRTRSQ